MILEYELNKKHFETFKKETLYWVEKLSMRNYEWNFCFEELEYARACVCIDVEGRLATMTLSKTWDVEPKSKILRRSAFHEVFEVLLGSLQVTALTSIGRDDLYNAELHNVIRRMENTQFVDDYNRRFKRKKSK